MTVGNTDRNREVAIQVSQPEQDLRTPQSGAGVTQIDTEHFEEEKSSKELLLNEAKAQAMPETTEKYDVLLAGLSENFKNHLDKAVADMKEQNRKDSEKMLTVLQQESTKRSALEQRLHSQLLLQNEFMVAMELKLMRLEAKVERREAAIRQQQRHPLSSSSYHRPLTAFQTIDESSVDMPASNDGSTTAPTAETPPNMAVINSSGASLASGVTAGSFLVDEGEDDEDDNDSGTRADDTIESDPAEPITREMDPAWSQHSTPTQGSRPRVAVGGESGRTLDSILLNPMLGETPNLQWSVRATRGQDSDGNSSLATSVTNSTYTSTVVTSTTRGDGSTINVRRIVPEEPELEMTPSRRGRSSTEEEEEGVADREETRSRSQSPLTVHSHASENISMASASTVGTSIRSSVAVAPRSGFGRRALSASTLTGSVVPSDPSRPLANRVVSFTTDPTNMTNTSYAEAGDSITIPDELDNFSEVADTFANSARVWREDYEARLDALQKKWSNE